MASKLAKSRFFSFHGIVALAIVILIIKGASGEGQAALFGSVLSGYIEESSRAVVSHSSAQITDINTLAAVESPILGHDASGEIIGAPALSTIQDNSLMASTPSSEDYIENGGFLHNQAIEYTVQSGDRIAFIASDYGVTVNSILWSNNLKDSDTIRPGQVLKIPPISGVIHKIKKGDTIGALAVKYAASADKISSFNDIAPGETLEPGQDIIIPDGKVASVPVEKTGVFGSAYTKIASIRTAEKFAYLPNLGGYFMIPATGFNWGILHGRNGVDLANSCGTPIYAAATGTIITADAAGWNGGFGKYIKIAHSNGTETLYGHVQKILVTLGQSVDKGQQIALMGTTGRSTGCHVHFEVHGARNPLAKY